MIVRMVRRARASRWRCAAREVALGQASVEEGGERLGAAHGGLELPLSSAHELA
jgi:hypothetical protein